ncbi:MAG: hypothetical protein KDI39_18115 [Pseudomonadales bacterium]|nr:hypothetical protein [Pseudomonadales bacterium]
MSIEQYRKEHCSDFVTDKCKHQEHANKVINELRKGSRVIYTNTNCGNGYFFVVGFVECLNELKLVGQDFGVLDDALECGFNEDKLVVDNFDEFFDDVKIAKYITTSFYKVKKDVKPELSNDEWECILSAVESYCLQLSKDGEHDYLKTMQEAQSKLLVELGMIET